ncbi:glycosyltransferase family 4 protein [Chelatococcus reniformis]
MAFYAPLKAPDHPVPSGDRTVARNLLRGLSAAGFAPEVFSRLRSHDPAGDGDRQHAIQVEAEAEARAIVARCRAAPEHARPRLWFTYHVYYKAPDWIGPAVARAMALPYVVAEGSRAGKRAASPWRLGHAGAEAALDQAALVFVLNEADRDGLARARPPGQRLVALPPFVTTLPAEPVARTAAAGPARLLAVAMMREGDKLASYRLLADALGHLEPASWTLDIVGDGPAKPEVERLFAAFGARVALCGAMSGAALDAAYASHDLLLWPAVNEAFGMVLLEAQAAGCPVVAGHFGGVAGVVRDGITGRLTPPGDAPAFAAATAALIAAPAQRRAMGVAARRFVVQERSLQATAGILRESLLGLLGGSPS